MNSLEDLLGVKVYVYYLVFNDEVLAYSWHFNKNKALYNLAKITKYHNLEGKIVFEKFNGSLVNEIEKVVLKGEKFSLPSFDYKNKKVYMNILDIPRGETRSYSEIAAKSSIRYIELLVMLLRNPFQVLIPCHRLLTKKGKLMGFYPLGKEVKMRLLSLEGVKLLG